MQSQPSHEKDTGYEGFKAIVKTVFNWKSNSNILKEKKSKCSRKEEGLQEILLKYNARSLL